MVVGDIGLAQRTAKPLGHFMYPYAETALYHRHRRRWFTGSASVVERRLAVTAETGPSIDRGAQSTFSDPGIQSETTLRSAASI
jgi:hypothetical protein